MCILAFIVLFGGMAALAVMASSPGPSTSDEVPPGIVLASKGLPENAGLYGGQLKHLPLAQSMDALEQLVDESTRVIVLDRSIRGELDSSFLVNQLSRGVYVFGLNLSERELKTVADWNQVLNRAAGQRLFNESPDDWEDSPDYSAFFTFVHLEKDGSRGGLGRLDVPAGLFQTRLAIAAGLACTEGESWSACRVGDSPVKAEERGIRE